MTVCVVPRERDRMDETGRCVFSTVLYRRSVTSNWHPQQQQLPCVNQRYCALRASRRRLIGALLRRLSLSLILLTTAHSSHSVAESASRSNRWHDRLLPLMLLFFLWNSFLRQALEYSTNTAVETWDHYWRSDSVTLCLAKSATSMLIALLHSDDWRSSIVSHRYEILCN